LLYIISEGVTTPAVCSSSEAMTVSNIVANIFIIFKELLQNMVKCTKSGYHNRLKHASFKCSKERCNQKESIFGLLSMHQLINKPQAALSTPIPTMTEGICLAMAIKIASEVVLPDSSTFLMSPFDLPDGTKSDHITNLNPTETLDDNRGTVAQYDNRVLSLATDINSIDLHGSTSAYEKKALLWMISTSAVPPLVVSGSTGLVC
jgi:hypothetical protein